MKLLAASILLCLAPVPVALAKLPPLSADAQAKADEAKAKTAWSDKVAAYQLCKAMDRTAEFYLKTAKSAGQETHAPAATPPCADPGPYVSASASAPATPPPGGQSAQAELQRTNKK